MPREHHASNPDRHPAAYYRIVQHDRPERLPLDAAIEREVRLREIGRKLLALGAGVVVLGITWAICRGVLAVAALFRK